MTEETTNDARCTICGWPYAKTRDEGCWPGDCSQRPPPKSRPTPPADALPTEGDWPKLQDCPKKLYLNAVGTGKWVWEHQEPSDGYRYKYIRDDLHPPAPVTDAQREALADLIKVAARKLSRIIDELPPYHHSEKTVPISEAQWGASKERKAILDKIIKAILEDYVFK